MHELLPINALSALIIISLLILSTAYFKTKSDILRKELDETKLLKSALEKNLLRLEDVTRETAIKLSKLTDAMSRRNP